ncbi:MAG: hypothetical protein M3Z26_06855 [Bacteroidota bacterium]|nr:hypothetical protein [Bacteroidota bacterium]
MLIKFLPYIFCLLLLNIAHAQSSVNTDQYDKKSEAKISVLDNILTVSWPVAKNDFGKLLLDLSKDKPLFKSIRSGNKEIAKDIDPAFILTIGKRNLISQNGWNIFFDKVPLKPHESYTVNFEKDSVNVISEGAHTIIRISKMYASTFSGALEITLYNGSPLFNVAAVMSTGVDSTAILYDAGLVSKANLWNTIAWSDVEKQMQYTRPNMDDTARNLEVKYRTVIGERNEGSLAIFPAPHQYFYPLDEAFNLKFTWYGNNYRKMIPGFGMGIRQKLEGDNRFVPWFNAPPGTQQRLNFFCLLSTGKATTALEEVKKFTHGDVYVPLPGYKTMESHFHNEFIMNVVLAGKPIPEHPAFVDVFKNTGVNIVHLAEFHYTAHPKGPDDQRLNELHALFEQCKRLSDKNFLLLPGEEPNEFFGGHWLEFFPKPVYWIMSRKPDMPIVKNDPKYGKVYRIADTADMLKLLKAENGLAWTAHARTKGSTGFPDAYKNEPFFKSDHFMGAAWKAMPANLSQPRLGKRVLDLMDDMNNWGLKKHVIGEADLFSIEPENEMYAHLNVNYLQLDKLPNFNDGWQPVLDAMRHGKFFTTTGEVLLPSFKVNGKTSNETIVLDNAGNAKIELEVNWTFPLNFVEIISGDGEKVYRDHINLDTTKAFGKQKFTFNTNLKNRTWVRVEAWDIAADGAFTQTVWIKK